MREAMSEALGETEPARHAAPDQYDERAYERAEGYIKRKPRAQLSMRIVPVLNAARHVFTMTSFWVERARVGTDIVASRGPVTARGSNWELTLSALAIEVERIWLLPESDECRQRLVPLIRGVEPLNETAFRAMVVATPMRLAHILATAPLPPGLLARGAEALGRAPVPIALPTLFQLLIRTEHAVVREGCVYGLAAHVDAVPFLRDVLRIVAAEDGSKGVREAAASVLEDLA